MTQEIKAKLAKVYALVDKGATEGERKAARHQLDKLLKKYNLEGVDLDSLDKTDRLFTFGSMIERSLFFALKDRFCPGVSVYRQTIGGRKTKTLMVELDHLTFIEMSSSFEYFRRHMNAEWKKACAAQVARKRTTKTKNETRKLLQQAFIAKYLVLSGLYEPKPEDYVSSDEISKAQMDAFRSVADIQGGRYHRQVQTAHQLPPAPKQEG